MLLFRLRRSDRGPSQGYGGRAQERVEKSLLWDMLTGLLKAHDTLWKKKDSGKYNQLDRANRLSLFCLFQSSFL